MTVFGNGNSARDYTYVADAVAGILAALDRAAGFEVVNLGSSRPVRLNALVELLERVTGQSAEIDRQPRPAADVPYTCADISRAKQLLDWSPQTSLERGLAQFIEWYRNAR